MMHLQKVIGRMAIYFVFQFKPRCKGMEKSSYANLATHLTKLGSHAKNNYIYRL